MVLVQHRASRPNKSANTSLTTRLDKTSPGNNLYILFIPRTVYVSSQGLHTSYQNRCVGQPAKEQKPAPVFVTNNVASFRENVMEKVYHYMTVYEEFIGIKQVKAAHERVLQAEERFVTSQERRRNAHSELVVMQNKLRELRGELDRTARGHEKYLELITKEINLMREERHYRQNFEDHEKREREAFNELSNALRFSHEKERAQNEKTKYWSLIGSLVGASVGIIVRLTRLQNRSRMAIAKVRKLWKLSYLRPSTLFPRK
ncbi:unnamed protein product [Allacma fusca]|uniref:Uncharacterized protein n=1 Tax=Allacma fusca TaxID=39272 RepID=A0A8J2NMT5_9HEXA|nr:unnamed protein product [Allacma fusca]